MHWKWGTPLTLETKNYVAKSIDPNNLPEQLIDWFADAELLEFVIENVGQSREQLEKKFARFNNKSLFALIIYARDIKQPIGLLRIHIEYPNSRAETSIIIGNRDYWGKNVVVEVRERMMRFLFTGVKINKISGTVRARNFPALFNYIKQGFRKEGILKQQVKGSDGAFEDVVLFGLLKSEWEAQRDRAHG
ncbi:GNAT family N-acetyltransferase [Sneathiella aquimaris]|uniref:GNAT family N-acetyltransferase n=1 Tax=Sneathiella aquimaris TaxID=2599305 RepID=UPI00146D515A|nr:GNAT family protein [Sneathiella aquimaris]